VITHLGTADAAAVGVQMVVECMQTRESAEVSHDREKCQGELTW
jgi:hypothetical protein